MVWRIANIPYGYDWKRDELLYHVIILVKTRTFELGRSSFFHFHLVVVVAYFTFNVTFLQVLKLHLKVML